MFEDVDLFQTHISFSLGTEDSPFFLTIASDIRTKQKSMEFQHFHEFYEIYILLDHDAGYFVEGQYYSINEGDMVFLKPGRLHKGTYGDIPVRRFLLSFTLPAIPGSRQFIRRLNALFDAEVPLYRLPLKTTMQNLMLLRDAFLEYHEHRDAAQPFVISQFLMFLYRMVMDAPLNTYQNKEFDTITHKMYSVANFIHKHYPEPLSLNKLASQFFISSSYLSRKFKDVSGYGIIEFIQQTRVKNAEEKLLSSNDGIQEICEACGFTSFSQFNRIFRKYAGLSPSLYRKQNKTKTISFP